MEEKNVTKKTAPNSVAALVLGICSIVLGCGFVGLVCGIVGLVLANKGLVQYNIMKTLRYIPTIKCSMQVK